MSEFPDLNRPVWELTERLLVETRRTRRLAGGVLVIGVLALAATAVLFATEANSLRSRVDHQARIDRQLSSQVSVLQASPGGCDRSTIQTAAKSVANVAAHVVFLDRGSAKPPAAVTDEARTAASIGALSLRLELRQFALGLDQQVHVTVGCGSATATAAAVPS